MTTLSTVATIVGLLTFGFNVAMFIVIKFNDLAHLIKDVAEIKKDLKELLDLRIEDAKDIATLKGRCQANHG